MCLPLLRRGTRGSIVPFFERSSRENSKTSLDPLLISRPLEGKKEGTTHESDRIVKTSLLQTGKGANDLEEENLEIEETSESSSSESDSEDIIVKTLQRPTKRPQEPAQEVPKKQPKLYKFKLVE